MRSRLSFLLLVALLLRLPHEVQAQTAAHPPAASEPAVRSLAPGPKPPDAPPEWKRHVGIYKYSSYQSPTSTAIILEREQKLYLRDSSGEETEISLKDGILGIPEQGGRVRIYSLHEEQREPEMFTYLMEAFTRTDGGSDPSRFYHITPSKPIAELRATALAARPPSEAQSFRKPELVELVTLDPTIHLDIRYAQSNNFLSTPVYTQARAFMQRRAAEALVRVSKKLQPLGYGLLIHDAYRPWYVTKMFWDATPPEGKQFVADPKQGSKHNRGCAVDLTLYDLASGTVEMPGLYDEMSPRSFPTFPGGTSLQRWHRDLLRRAMESEGFAVNESEWWHFDYREWRRYPILNLPFEDLGKSVGQLPADAHLRSLLNGPDALARQRSFRWVFDPIPAYLPRWVQRVRVAVPERKCRNSSTSAAANSSRYRETSAPLPRALPGTLRCCCTVDKFGLC